MVIQIVIFIALLAILFLLLSCETRSVSVCKKSYGAATKPFEDGSVGDLGAILTGECKVRRYVLRESTADDDNENVIKPDGPERGVRWLLYQDNGLEYSPEAAAFVAPSSGWYMCDGQRVFVEAGGNLNAKNKGEKTNG